MPNFFKDYASQEGFRERSKAAAENAYEERVVTYLLKAFSLPKTTERELRDRDGQGKRRGRLTCDAFRSLFPTFPVLLGTNAMDNHALHKDPRLFLPNLFKSFLSCPFVASFDALGGRIRPAGSDKPLALVFPRKGIIRGLVLHDGEDLPPAVFRGLVMMYVSPKEPRRTLFLQPCVTFFDGLYRHGHGWRPPGVE